MDFSFSEEQEMLRKTARDFLSQKYPKKLVRDLEESETGYLPALWQEMAGLGWMGLAFPEKYGGAGMGFFDLAVLLEEMGRACMPGPFFSTVILGGLAILDAGSDAQKEEYLPKIASGKAIFTQALTESSASYDIGSIMTKATVDIKDSVISGTKLFVPDAHIADYMLVVAGTGDQTKLDFRLTSFIVDAKSPGITCTPLKTMAGDKLSKVDFYRVKVPSSNILGKAGEGWGQAEKTMLRAAVGKCCEMVGAAQQVLAMTIEYAKTRVQFGHPIGSFQAIQQHCANMAIDVETSKVMAYKAAWMLSQGLPCTREAAIAKAWTAAAYQRVVYLGHQVHGAIGFTMDHDLQFYSRRAKSAEVNFGDVTFHRETVAREIGLK